MYLTASRPDIMFPVCACARFQVTQKTSHLHAVKRIFRYLKGQPKLGLWYPRDSPFDLEAFSDSDYAGASLDRKSTTRGCQFLGKRLISRQCKKQTIVANSTTEVEYVATANCCGDSYEKKLVQVIKIHTDHNVVDLLTKAFDVSRMERAATTASRLEAEQDNGNINRTQSMATLNESFPQGTDSGSGPRCQDTILGDAEAQIRIGVDTTRHKLNTASIKYALTKSPTIYVSLIEQFWQTASASTLENGDMEITATIDGKVKMSAQTRGRHEHDFKESDFEFIAPKEDYTTEPDISTVGVEVSTVSPEVKIAAESLVYIRRCATKRKDKGKAIMKEAELVQKKTKLQLEQERHGLEEAMRLQEQLDKEERQRIARVHEEASTFNAEE
ncbi:hypothetical protein Tco_0567466 [Tanacetum coccineum]